MTNPLDAREALIRCLADLETRAGRLVTAITEPMSADSEEQAVEAEDDDALLAEESLIMHRIMDIRAAIKRVDEGRYGLCMTCGETISSARLDAVPEAKQCIDCANAEPT